MSEKTRRNRFQEAAEECGVPVAELKLWLIEHVKVSQQRWSKWEHGVEGIPEKHLVAFLAAKLAEKRSRSSAG